MRKKRVGFFATKYWDLSVFQPKETGEQVSNLSKGKVLFLVACADKGTFSHLAWVDRPSGVFAKKREERKRLENYGTEGNWEGRKRKMFP